MIVGFGKAVINLLHKEAIHRFRVRFRAQITYSFKLVNLYLRTNNDFSLIGELNY